MVDSRADYFKERRKEKKNFSVYIDKDLSEKIEGKIKSEDKTKTEWLNQQMEDYMYEHRYDDMDEEPSEGISLKKCLRCPCCKNDIKLDFDDYLEYTENDERSMGPEITYYFKCEDYRCPRCDNELDIHGHICEYPLGSFNSEAINITPKEDEEE